MIAAGVTRKAIGDSKGQTTTAAAERLLSGWGRTVPTRARVHRVAVAEDVGAVFATASPRGVLARGLGRSYGDAAQNAGGDVLGMTSLHRVHGFDPERGIVVVDAGASIDALIRLLLPLGWFLPVSPGTRYVTVGGAIAGDIHGKNHHRDGSFCEHVSAFVLQTPAGNRIDVTPQGSPDVFWATAGGMGLTGVVLRATLQLLRVQTSHMCVVTQRTADLQDTMVRMAAGDDSYRYSVAWIDCLARGRRLGRAVLLGADHAAVEDLPERLRSSPLARSSPGSLAAPPRVPVGLVNRLSVGVLNRTYYHRAPRTRRISIQPLDRFFYPLDGVREWNRLYGPRGFLQYQFVVPFGHEDVIRCALERLSEGGCPAFLAVLKRFGGQQGMLSFPMPGWTLAFDIPATAPGLVRRLDGLDRLVAGAGGRVYLAKDSRLRPELLETLYPRLDTWRAIRSGLDPDRVMRSDLDRRLGLAG